jgi:inhibitor of KinA sporulation pathway (predicted exonuclease)
MAKEDAQFLAWYDRKGEELKAQWLEEIDPEIFDEFEEYVHSEFDRGGDPTDDGDADYDQWYRIHTIDLMAAWLKSIDPEQFDKFWRFVNDEYEYA